jgi:hypothetical protein
MDKLEQWQVLEGKNLKNSKNGISESFSSAMVESWFSGCT